MKLMVGENDLTGRLRAANPLPSGITHTEATRARLEEIRLWARSGPREPAKQEGWRASIARRGARRSVVAASAIGVLLVGGAAAATTVLSTSATGTGEPGYCQTATNATADVPFPSGDQAARNWALLASAIPKQGATLDELCAGDNVTAGDRGPFGGTVPVQVGVINEKATFVMVALCAWTNQWLTAEQNGDNATASSAASEIAGALQWPSAQDVANAHSETLNWIPSAQQAVQAENVSEVASMFKYEAQATAPTSACVFYTPPAGSDNGTVNSLTGSESSS